MRSYGAQDIISLPTLNTASAIALGQELLTAVKAHTDLPQLIATRASALDKAHAALSVALSNKPQTQTDPLRARTTDQAEDHAFSCLHDWLYGWCKLSSADADQARTMFAVIFPDGLKFIRLPYKQEWAEAQTKLARIASEGYDTEITKLGGKPILDQLQAAHKAYGEALGITVESPDSTINLREPLLAFNKYLRAYVVAVTAQTDPDDAEEWSKDHDPTSGALADALLAPLHKWQTYVTVTAPEPQPVVTPTPVVSPTPVVPTPAPAPKTTNGPGVETGQH